MTTLEEALALLDRPMEKGEVETYILRRWVRPQRQAEGWHFEDIDIARLRLVCHLTQEIRVNDEGVDVALSLLDQLYGLRAHMRRLTHAVTRQSPEVRHAILALMREPEQSEDAQ